jgi:hypothetical protein
MWNRSKAAIALGRRFEQQRNPQQALPQYEVALEFLRKVYPYHHGVRSRLLSDLAPAAKSDAEECQLVADLVADLTRLAPEKHREPTGRIKVSLEGEPLPQDVKIALGVELSDTSITQLDEGLPHRLPRLVQLDQTGIATMEVLKGHYRLRATGHQSQWGTSSERFMRLMQIDTDHWPTEVTIGDEGRELPPARIRLADEIRLLSPEQAVPVRLNDAVFRWRPVPNAAYYQIQFLYSTESPHPTSTTFAFIRVNEPQLQLSKLETADRKAIAENLLTGRTGGWSVVAYDANDRRVGISLEERRFLVAEQLSHE